MTYGLIGLCLAAVFSAALVFRLLSGPIWSDTLARMASDRIAGELGPGATVDVGVVGFALDDDFRPEVHLRDVVIAIPGAGTLSLDTLAATGSWRGPAAGTDRFVADHVLAVVDEGEGPMPPVGDLVHAVESAIASPRVRYLEIGSLTAMRRSSDGTRTQLLAGAAVTISAAGDGAALLTMAGEGTAGPWSLKADAAVPENGRRKVSVATNGLDVADVAAMIGGAAPPATGPVGFDGDVTVEGGKVVEGGGQLTLGPLEETGDASLPVAGGRGRFEVSIRPGGKTIVLLPSPVVLPGGQALVGGTIEVPETGTAWPFSLRLMARDTTGEDERRGLADLAGRYDPVEGLLVVDRIEAAGEGARFDAAMRVSHGTDHVSGALSGVFASMSVDVLKTVWPSFAVADARNWVMENVESGTISDATVDLAFLDRELGPDTAGTAGATVRFSFDGLAFRAFDDGPMIRGASGIARLEDGRFEVTLEKGHVDLGPDGILDIPRGTFAIPDVDVDPPDGFIDMSLAGDARATLALWQRLPLAAGRPLPSKPEGASGTVEGDVRLSLPLEKDVPAEKVVYDATIRIRDLAFAAPVEGRKLTAGDLDIRVHEGTAEIKGKARLDGVQAEVDLVEALEGGGVGSSAIKLRLTGPDRKKLGIDLGDILAGPVSVRVGSVDGDADGAKEIEVDLAEARLRIAPLGINKPKGEPGSVRFKLTEGDGRIAVRDLRLEAGGARASGNVTLASDGQIISADLPKLAPRSGDDLSLKVRRGDDGVLDVEVRGDRFDARRVVRSQLRGAGSDAAGGTLRIDVAIGSVTGFSEEALSGFNLDAAVDGGRVSALALTAQTAGGGSASLTLTPVKNSNRRLEMEAGEVGRLLRFLGIYKRVYGGRAVVTGVVDAAGGVRASVDGSRLRIVDEPALARLSTAAETGPSAGLATVEIARLLFDLGFSEGRLVIEDGVVRAATAGLSLQGDIDFNREALRLAGTYLPTSQLDSLLGKIPLIGQTMFAGGRAGLLGVTFRLSGAIDDPVLTVNPLSAIAPGIFRKVFELR